MKLWKTLLTIGCLSTAATSSVANTVWQDSGGMAATMANIVSNGNVGDWYVSNWGTAYQYTLPANASGTPVWIPGSPPAATTVITTTPAVAATPTTRAIAATTVITTVPKATTTATPKATVKKDSGPPPCKVMVRKAWVINAVDKDENPLWTAECWDSKLARKGVSALPEYHFGISLNGFPKVPATMELPENWRDWDHWKQDGNYTTAKFYELNKF